MVDISALTFRYSPGRPLFDNLNLRLQPGGVYGLLGKNGAGKTTLLNILTGLLSPNSGSCAVDGRPSSARSPLLLENLYYVPEELYLPPMTMVRYERFYAPFYPRFDSDTHRRLLQELELPADHDLASLSFGQKKKFVIAFGIAANTRLLVLDEPTNGLDIPSKRCFRTVLASAASPDRTMLVSTHQVRDMEGLIDPIVIIDSGRIILNRSIADISARLAVQQCRDMTEAPQAVYWEKVPGGYSAIVKGPGSPENPIDIELLFNMAVSDEAAVRELLGEEPAHVN